MTATRNQLNSAQASVDAHNRSQHTRYREIARLFPKNAPSPFRPNMADAATIEAGQDIAAEQAAIKAEQQSGATALRRANKLRRELNADSRVPASRLEIAAQIRKELTIHADTTPNR